MQLARVKQRSLKRALILPFLMILAGILILNPTQSFGAKVDSNVAYFYPTKANNPVQPNGLFWLESAPQIGSLTLEDWRQIIPNRAFAIGVPDSHVLSAGMLGSAFRVVRKSLDTPRRPGQIGGEWQKYALEKKDQNKKDPPEGGTKNKDVLVYKRTIGPDGLKEEVTVKVGDHFANNDNFDRYVDKIRDKLVTDPKQVKEAMQSPKVKSFWDSGAEITLGGGLVLSGLLSALKVLWPVVFAL